MEFKLNEIVALTNIIVSIREQKLPIKTAFKLNKIFILTNGHYQFFQQELKKIIEEYAEKDEQGEFIPTSDRKGYKIKKGYELEVAEKIEELENLDIKLTDFEKFTLDELDMLQLNLQEMNALYKFIEAE